jgi:hypothetical protein
MGVGFCYHMCMGYGMTFRLFAEPSFLEGVARLVDLGATLNVYNESGTPAEADQQALLSDWMTVGEDIQMSIYAYEQQSAH